MSIIAENCVFLPRIAVTISKRVSVLRERNFGSLARGLPISLYGSLVLQSFPKHPPSPSGKKGDQAWTGQKITHWRPMGGVLIIHTGVSIKGPN